MQEALKGRTDFDVLLDVQVGADYLRAQPFVKPGGSYENLADDVAALLDYLEIPSADLIGYSMGGGVAMQCAIRHPEKVRKVVSISAVFRHDGWVKEALDPLI